MYILPILLFCLWAFRFWLKVWSKEQETLDKFAMKDWLLNLDKVTRLEVISHTREYQNHEVSNCKVSLQDKERTLKVFITNK